MYCNPIAKGYHTQNSAFKFINPSPESDSPILLSLHTQRIFNNPNAPLLLQIRTLPSNFILKVFGEGISGHLSERKG